MSFREVIGTMLGAIGRTFAFLRIAVANVAVGILLLVVVVLIVSSPGAVQLRPETALLLRPAGAIVEQRAYVESLSGLVAGPTTSETVLGDIIEAIETARDDDRIEALVVNPTELAFASTAQLNAIGDAIEDFKTSGKRVIAFGEYFTQGQYFLASFADEVYMHPMGELLLTGFGAYQSYYQGLIDKLEINVHVFRVGTFKSAVEPYTRSDMSEAAKSANRELIDQLWRNYVQRISANRALSPGKISEYAQEFDTLLQAAKGDMARVALEHGLVDELLTAEELEERLKQRVGQDEGHYRHADIETYLAATRMPRLSTSANQIAVVIASGNIMMGERPRGAIGSASLTALIRQAREDEAIKGLVLRIDSPGGSAFASELIRQELELLQTTGKPVIVSMAGAAASGGYWIAATADEIWAAPTTVTGSIGVFGILPTFEDTLARVGVERDGVATSPFAGGVDPTGGINERMANVLQASVDFNYRRFIELVARGRELDPEAVDAIGQGRVWTGTDALEHGLVDHLGHLDDAIASAAALLELDEWEVRYLERPLSAREQLIGGLTDTFGLNRLADDNPIAPLLSQLASQSMLKDLVWLSRLDDPKHVYAVCDSCGIARRF